MTRSSRVPCLRFERQYFMILTFITPFQYEDSEKHYHRGNILVLFLLSGSIYLLLMVVANIWQWKGDLSECTISDGVLEEFAESL
jgi:hypothetical protein